MSVLINHWLSESMIRNLKRAGPTRNYSKINNQNHIISPFRFRRHYQTWSLWLAVSLFWDFLLVRWTPLCPKARRQKDLNISQLAGTYFHLADWQMISFPCGCSLFQKIFILPLLGRAACDLFITNWNVSWCPNPESRILLRRSLTVISGDTNIADLKVASEWKKVASALKRGKACVLQIESVLSEYNKHFYAPFFNMAKRE